MTQIPNPGRGSAKLSAPFGERDSRRSSASWSRAGTRPEELLETDVPGLLPCRASTPSGHGIANVMLSGLLAAGAATETDLLPGVLADDVSGDGDPLPPLRDDWDARTESH